MSPLDPKSTTTLAPPPRPRRRARRLLRDALLVLLVTGVVLGVALARGPNQAKMLYYQYRALHYSAPASDVVYRYVATYNPFVMQQADHLDDGGHRSTSAAVTALLPLPLPTHAVEDTCVLLPPHIIPPGGAGDPPALDMLNRYLNYTLSDFTQVLFCHALRTPRGDTRLAIVSFGPDIRAPQAPGIYDVILLEPVTLSGTPRLIARQHIAATDPRLAHSPAAFHAGQTDPDDSSAFFLSYDIGPTLNPVHRTLRGTLDPSGKRITLNLLPLNAP